MITNKKQIKFHTKTNESLNYNPFEFLKIKFYNKGKQNKEIFQKSEILKKANICLKSFVLFYFINSIITIIFSLKSSYTEIIITIQGKEIKIYYIVILVQFQFIYILIIFHKIIIIYRFIFLIMKQM